MQPNEFKTLRRRVDLGDVRPPAWERSDGRLGGLEYMVGQDGRVFVLTKLGEDIAAMRSGGDQRSLEDLVREATPKAWMTSIDAVRQQGLRPGGFRIEKDSEDASAFRLEHVALAAHVPARFASRAQAEEALAAMLIGQAPGSGDGEFTWKGVPLVRSRAIGLAALGAAPALPRQEGDVEPAVDNPDHYWRSGYPEMTPEALRALFYHARDWLRTSAAVQQDGKRGLDSAWGAIGAMVNGCLAAPGYAGTPASYEAAKRLRAARPELAGMDDRTLAWYASQYAINLSALRTREIVIHLDPTYDTGFPAYLVGCLALQNLGHTSGLAVREAGWVALGAIVRGLNQKAALRLAGDWPGYYRALSREMQQVNMCMRAMGRRHGDLRTGDVRQLAVG